MNKSLHELVTYIWIPFILGFVFYVFRDMHDLPLAIVMLIAFSAIYTLIRVYFAHKDWRLLAAIALVIVGTLGYVFLRPQGITLSVNGQDVITSSVSFNEGSVSVYPAPGGDGKYSKGTVVSLTASPATGYELKNWTGTSNDISNTTTVTLGGNKQVTVTFETRPSLIINNQEVIGAVVSFTDGSVTISPPPDADGRYAKGAIVHLTARPASGYDWISWTGADGDTSNPATVTMSARKQVSVTFEHRFALFIGNEQAVGSTVNFNEGSVSLDPAPGDDDQYAKGTVVTLKANPDPAYGFKTWSGTGSDASNPTTITINSDKHVIVTFELRYALTVNNISVNGTSINLTEGSISLSRAPLADTRYAINTPVTLTANPAASYRFDHWSGDTSGNTATVTINMNLTRNITAVFQKVYSLTNSVNTTGGGSVSPTSSLFDAGSTVTLTATPDTGYRFDRWYGDASGTTATITVSMNSDKKTSASFKKVYTLTTSVNPAGSGNVSASGGIYDEGAFIILTAQAAGGYSFDHWEGDASGNVTSANVTMTSNKSVTAFFRRLAP